MLRYVGREVQLQNKRKRNETEKIINYIEIKERLLVTTSSTPGARASGRSGFSVGVLEAKGAHVHPQGVKL